MHCRVRINIAEYSNIRYDPRPIPGAETVLEALDVDPSFLEEQVCLPLLYFSLLIFVGVCGRGVGDHLAGCDPYSPALPALFALH